MLQTIFFIYIAVINIVGFAIMGIDKKIARKNGDAGTKRDKSVPTRYRRVPEATLMTIAFMLGAIGCYVGMHVFRHKTQKAIFYIGVPFMVAVNAVIAYLIYENIIL